MRFPEATRIHRRMPKEKFYQFMRFTKAMKTAFTADVDSIYAEYSLTRESLHFDKESAVKEIIVLLIHLRSETVNPHILELIARQNPHKLLFLLAYGEERKLALYRGKFYSLPWLTEKELPPVPSAFSMDELWDGLTEAIALAGDSGGAGFPIDERLRRKEAIETLHIKIKKWEMKIRKEIQPKKKFALYEEMKPWKEELARLTGKKD